MTHDAFAASPDQALAGLVATELRQPDSTRDRLAHAVVSSLEFVGSFTDLLIHAGSPVQIKSAKGVVPLSKRLPFLDDFVVSKEDIQSFFAFYLDSFETLDTLSPVHAAGNRLYFWSDRIH